MSFPTRLLTDTQIDDTKQVVSATCNKAVGRNFIRGKFGRFINIIKIAYLSSKINKSNSGSNKCDIVSILEDFEHSDQIAFATLSDVPIDQLTENITDDRMTPSVDTVTISSTNMSNKTVINTEIAALEYGEKIEQAAKEERKSKQMKKNDTLFVSIAWLIIPAFQFFRSSGEM